MLFMCIETYKNQDARTVYRRFRDKGRQMPEGLTFVGSWVTADLDRCFQLMECDDITLLQQWIVRWSDIIHFEILPVVAGKDVAGRSRRTLAAGIAPPVRYDRSRCA